MANLVVPATPLGNVMPLPKGEWIAGVTYKPLNIVKHKNSTYIALLENAAEPSGDTDANWMLVVKGTEIATTELAGKVKPDGTTITISEDGTITGAKQVPDNVLVAVEIDEDDPDSPPLQAPLIDADRLGGELPEYFATAESVADILAKIEELGSLSTEEKEAIKAAISDLQKEAGELGTSVEEVENQLKSAGLNSYNLGGASKWDNIAKSTSLPLTFFTNWSNTTELPVLYGSGVIIPGLDGTVKFIIYVGSTGGATANRNMWLGYMKFSDITTYTITWRKLISDEELPEMVSNPNILINSDFRNTINQRGQTSYTLERLNQYCVDRWNCSNTYPIVEVLKDGLKVSRQQGYTHFGVCQFLENLEPGNYVFSCKISEINSPTIHAYSHDFENHYDICEESFETKPGIYKFKINISKKSRKINVMLYGQEAEVTTNNYYFIVEWMKLEAGDIATMYVPPNQAEELVKCQRYYQEVTGGFFATIVTTDRITFSVPIYGKMRTNPTAKLKNDNINTLNGVAVISTLGTAQQDFSFEVLPPTNSLMAAVVASKKSHELNRTNCSLRTIDLNPICLDAEIY